MDLLINCAGSNPLSYVVLNARKFGPFSKTLPLVAVLSSKVSVRPYMRRRELYHWIDCSLPHNNSSRKNLLFTEDEFY